MTRERKQTQPTARKTHTGTRANLCPSDGATLDPHGYCWTGGGYPVLRWWWDTQSKDPHWTRITASCTFTCPICRQGLSWDGGCLSCYGSQTAVDKRTWTFPGDSYVLQDRHWVREHGPCKASTPEQVKAGSASVKLVMDGTLTAAEGLVRLRKDGVIA
jgi:hypothetical protein